MPDFHEHAQTQHQSAGFANFLRARGHRGIVNVTLTVAALTAVVKAGSVFKELVIAGRFGTSDDLDAFLISVLVPSATITIIAGSFSAAFIPLYIRLRQHEGEKVAQNLLREVMGWALPLLALTTALIIAGAPIYLPVIGSGFTIEKLHLTFVLLCLNAPIVMLSGMAVIWSAALNTEGHFALSAISPLGISILTILLLWLAPSGRSFALIGGVVGGAAFEMFLLGLALRRKGFSLYPRWPRLSPNVRRLARQYGPVMGGAIVMSGNSVIDQAMAAMLPAGSVAVLSYGNRVVQFCIMLSAAALGTTLIPYFSRLAADRKWDELNRIVHRSLRLTLLLTVPLALLLFFCSEPLVNLLFRRGAFTASDAHTVGKVQAFYALQIPSFIAGTIVVRLIQSIQANRILLWVASINLIMNISLNFLFMRWLGVAGIALSTAVVFLFSTTFCYFAAVKQMPRDS